MEHDDNPPVSPIINNGEVFEAGIRLRDYFAAKAMTEANWYDIRSGAEACYAIADAMLEARNK